MHLIERPAHARALLQADPAMAINAAVLLGKVAKPEMAGKELVKAQLSAWNGFCDAMDGQRFQPKKKRRP
jgi:hypothetical protein